jgi:PilZ domain
MVDSMNRRELLRLSVTWLLTIRTESGNADGETRNITGEGFFLYCSERLREGVAYPVTIKLPEKRVEMTGKVTWSNIDNCTSLNFSPAMGFYFMRIDENKDKQILREAIAAELKKPPRLRQQADRPGDSPLSGEAKATARPDGTARNTQVPRNE